MTGGVLHGSPWKVFLASRFRIELSLGGLQGDVSLSAEDKPHADVAIPQQEDGGNEEPRDWLMGHTAHKFLLAGGVAGAGRPNVTPLMQTLEMIVVNSVPHLYCPIRSP
jgi:hypothetical protein